MTPPLSDLGILVIDMQDRFLNPWTNTLADKNLLIKSVQSLLNYAPVARIRTWLVEYDFEHMGKTVDEITGNCKYPIFGKMNSGAFEQIGVYNYPDSTGSFYTTCDNILLDEILCHQGIKKLIVAGVCASACVDRTIKGARELGYKVKTAPELIANNFVNLKGFNSAQYLDYTLSEYQRTGVLADSWQEAVKELGG